MLHSDIIFWKMWSCVIWGMNARVIKSWPNVCNSFFHYSLPKVFSSLLSATFDLFHWDWKAWVKAPKVVLTFSKVFLHFFWESNDKVMRVWKLTFGYPTFERGLWWDCKSMQTIWSCLPKGQLISKCPFGAIVSTKIPTKKFDNFCPRIWKVVTSTK
jgi:hypothetical protein